MTIQPFPSRLDDPSARRLGTFSYLPPMTDDEIRAQVAFMVAQGWSCSVEHVEPDRAERRYWYLWKLPMFGERSVDAILAEVGRCAQANPLDHVRLVGYDARHQTSGLAFVVRRAGSA
jgi:ribulose-bisphosphate carboxylase small chain